MSSPSAFRPKNLPTSSTKVVKVKSYDVRFRSSMRGLKRCASCGQYSAQRAQLCRNEKCELRRLLLASRRPFDPVQLVTYTGAKLYSLRAKEPQPQPRNFVQITEITLALEEHTHSSIVSLDCVCYTDTCKYDSYDAAGIACKHIKACQTSSTTQIPQAYVYQIVREVLWNLNISSEQKQRLWDAYKAAESEVPAIQRLSATTFAVKCAQSKVFPAGRLHVTAVCGNSLAGSAGLAIAAAPPSKKHTHACACKKLKIVLEPDNSVVMQDEICDHLLLVLAAILSTPHGKTLYGNFTSALKSYWMPAALETPVGDATSEDADAFFGLSINIGGSFGGDGCGDGETAADDIFIFGDEFFDDDNIPDFSDILDLAPHTAAVASAASTAVSTKAQDLSPSSSSTLVTPNDLLHAGDPNLVSSCCDINEVDDDVDIKFHDVTAATTIASAAPLSIDSVQEVATHLELSDCNIELMDQFQLTDQIDLCSESTELFDAGGTLPVAIIELDANMTQNQAFLGDSGGRTSLLKSSSFHIAAPLPLSTPPLLPPPLPVELPTIAVVKKCPIKVLDSVRKCPQISRNRALIVNSAQKEDDSEKAAAKEPSLTYSAWLDYVIECINESVDITEETHVSHSFHVHEEVFEHFSKSFSVGVKRRVPNTSVAVKHGRYKGLIKYAWYFHTASTVRRIFSSKNISLIDERSFECDKDGSFVPYVRPEVVSVFNGTTQAQHHRHIYPKPSLYKAHIWFESSNSLHKSGVKLEWLPNAFPKSHYGILKIQFSIGVKEPA